MEKIVQQIYNAKENIILIYAFNAIRKDVGAMQKDTTTRQDSLY